MQYRVQYFVEPAAELIAAWTSLAGVVRDLCEKLIALHPQWPGIEDYLREFDTVDKRRLPGWTTIRRTSDRDLQERQARIVRPGADVTLVGLSITVGTCVAAAAELAADGIEAEVIDLRTLVPLDAAAVLGSVARTGRLVVVEENPGQLGWGASVAAIAAQEAFGSLAAPVTRVSGGNVPLPVAASLEAEVDVSVPRVVAATQAVRSGAPIPIT